MVAAGMGADRFPDFSRPFIDKSLIVKVKEATSPSITIWSRKCSLLARTARGAFLLWLRDGPYALTLWHEHCRELRDLQIACNQFAKGTRKTSALNR